MKTLTKDQQALLERIQSEKPTRYRVREHENHEAYLFCSYDAMLYTLLTDIPVVFEATPPEGEALTFTLAPQGPERTDLWHGYTESVTSLPHAPGMPSTRCPYLHVFATHRDAQRWHRGLPLEIAGIVAILPFDHVWQKARARVEALAEG